MFKGMHPIKLAGAGLLVMLASLFTTSVFAQTDLCEYDEAEMLAIDPWDFDQDPDSGWQKLAAHEDCVEVAADLIRIYYENREMPEGGHRIMVWHEGQLRAEIGQTEEAINLFKQAYNPEDSTGWNYYVDATIAFLQDDLDRLQTNREKLAAVPEPENFNPVDEDGNPVDFPWPMNLHVVDRLIECFGADYIVAYSGCDPE